MSLGVRLNMSDVIDVMDALVSSKRQMRDTYRELYSMALAEIMRIKSQHPFKLKGEK